MKIKYNMTQEEKAKAYDEALKAAVVAHKDEDRHLKATLERIFPELKEGEDERIRKEIISALKYANHKGVYDKHLAWLEKQGSKKSVHDLTQQEAMDIAVAKCFKQGDQKTADKIEPKFREGDWIISNDKKSTYQVIEVKRGIYVIRDNADNHEYHIGIEECEKSGRLWTVHDAKDGDVLFHSDSASNGIFIFKELSKRGSSEKVICYSDYDSEDYFCLGENHTCCWADAKILHPSTKEQRDLFFAKMKEEGYDWDADKKELKRIEQKLVEEKELRRLNPNTVWNSENVVPKYNLNGLTDFIISSAYGHIKGEAHTYTTEQWSAHLISNQNKQFRWAYEKDLIDFE